MKKKIVFMKVVTVFVIALLVITTTSQGTDLLNWTPDSGIRIPGGSNPAVQVPLCVMQRPDGLWGMYFYQGDAENYGDTGYATSSNGTDWTVGNKVMLHGGHGFDNVNANIGDIVTLPNGHLRAYCNGMQSNQGDAPTSIFTAESADSYGMSWTKGSVIVSGSGSLGQVGCPRVFASSDGYIMYYSRNDTVYRTTSADGLTDWSPAQSVVTGVGGFDIVDNSQDGELSMFALVYTGGHRNVIRSLSSSDGIDWVWDPGDRLVPEPFVGETGNISGLALANINGVDRMYISGRPIYYHPNTLSNIYSATAVPEPATLLLLGLGGLMLRKRRLVN